MHSRTPQACIPCRQRKSKCNGAKPSCRKCMQRRKLCIWPETSPDTSISQSCDVQSEESLPKVSSALSERQCKHLQDIFFSEPSFSLLRLSIHQPKFLQAEQAPILLFSIYCLTALFISDNDAREIFNSETALGLSKRLLEIARKFPQLSLESINVSAIQAHLIICYRDLLCREGIDAWMSAGVAIRKAQALRLGREYHQQHSPVEREIRRRVMWTCYIMDQLVSFATSRPRTIQLRTVSIGVPCAQSVFLFEEESTMPPLSRLTGGHFDGTNLLPYLLKALQLWADIDHHLQEWMIGQSPVDFNENSKLAHDLLTWLATMPPRVQWSQSNYAAYYLLGNADIFALMHMLLHHALCLIWRRSLPHGDNLFAQAQESTNHILEGCSEGIAYCRSEALIIIDIVRAVHQNKQGNRMLFSAFTGLVLTAGASVFIWLAKAMPILPVKEVNLGQDLLSIVAEANESVLFIKDILRAYSKNLEIVATWLESISFLEQFYAVAYCGKMTSEDTDGGLTATLNTPSTSIDIAGGSGLPDTVSVVMSWPLSRQALLYTAGPLEPTAARVELSRVHIRELWKKIWSEASVITPQAWLDTIDLDLSFMERV